MTYKKNIFFVFVLFGLGWFGFGFGFVCFVFCVVCVFFYM